MSSICFLSFGQQATVGLRVIWRGQNGGERRMGTGSPFLSAQRGHYESLVERAAGQGQTEEMDMG